MLQLPLLSMHGAAVLNPEGRRCKIIRLSESEIRLQRSVPAGISAEELNSSDLQVQTDRPLTAKLKRGTEKAPLGVCESTRAAHTPEDSHRRVIGRRRSYGRACVSTR